jgi:hypothetical protein
MSIDAETGKAPLGTYDSGKPVVFCNEWWQGNREPREDGKAFTVRFPTSWVRDDAEYATLQEAFQHALSVEGPYRFRKPRRK